MKRVVVGCQQRIVHAAARLSSSSSSSSTAASSSSSTAAPNPALTIDDLSRQITNYTKFPNQERRPTTTPHSSEQRQRPQHALRSERHQQQQPKESPAATIPLSKPFLPRIRLKPKRAPVVADDTVAATATVAPSSAANSPSLFDGVTQVAAVDSAASPPHASGLFGGVVDSTPPPVSEGLFGGVVAAPRDSTAVETKDIAAPTTMFGGVVKPGVEAATTSPITELIPPIDGGRVGEPIPITQREVSKDVIGGELLPSVGSVANGPISSQAEIDALLLDDIPRFSETPSSSSTQAAASVTLYGGKQRLVPTRERMKEPEKTTISAPKKVAAFEFIQLPVAPPSGDTGLYGDRFAQVDAATGSSSYESPAGNVGSGETSHQSAPKEPVNTLAVLRRSLQMEDTTTTTSQQQHNVTETTGTGATSKLSWFARPKSSNFLSSNNDNTNNGDHFSLWSRHNNQTTNGGGSQQPNHRHQQQQQKAAMAARRRNNQSGKMRDPEVSDRVRRLKKVLHKNFPKTNAAPLPDGTILSSQGKPCSLQDMIRKIQQRNVAEKLAAPASAAPASATEEKKVADWRVSLPKRGFLADDMENTPTFTPPQEVTEEPPEEPKHTPTFVDPKLQEVTIPFYDTSLVEASLLFRAKTGELTASLERIGSEVPKEEERKKFKLKQDIMELMAIDLGQKYTLAQRPVVDDDADRLMQHRAVEAANKPSRPPVVSVMGHVDHGKTTLMDALRRKAGVSGGATSSKKSKKKKKETKKPSNAGNVAGTEAGGITQVITAFQVPLLDPTENGRDAVTFLDTPGHAAFKAMRQSGSDAADIIVLVVAADDGVSPQTIEILDFYKSIVKESGESGISLVVALNKIDKPGIDADESMMRVANQLLEQGIVTENNVPSDPTALDGFEIFGPPVQIMPVSGLRGTGLDDLVESLALQSEVMDLRADDKALAEGVIMDAKIEKGLGVVASCIIRWGSLAKGDIIVSGSCSGKIRILKDVGGKQLKAGLPSQPVQLVGFDEVPRAGDPFICVDSDHKAQEMVTRRKALAEGERQDQQKDSEETKSDLELHSSGRDMMNHDWKVSLEQKHGVVDDQDTGVKEIRIPILIKADADGTLAAIRESLIEIGSNAKQFNVVVDPISAEIGPLLGSEIELAKESNAAIFCFNVKPDATMMSLATENEITIFDDKVIYRLLDAAKLQFAKYLPSEQVDVVHGRAKVQQVFSIGGMDDKVAGSMVLEGQLLVGRHYRVIRDGTTISDRPLEASSLKHFKEDVDEVSRGKECGLALRGFSDIQDGDEIECYTVETRYPEL